MQNILNIFHLAYCEFYKILSLLSTRQINSQKRRAEREITLTRRNSYLQMWQNFSKVNKRPDVWVSSCPRLRTRRYIERCNRKCSDSARKVFHMINKWNSPNFFYIESITKSMIWFTTIHHTSEHTSTIQIDYSTSKNARSTTSPRPWIQTRTLKEVNYKVFVPRNSNIHSHSKFYSSKRRSGKKNGVELTTDPPKRGTLTRRHSWKNHHGVWGMVFCECMTPAARPPNRVGARYKRQLFPKLIRRHFYIIHK